MSDVKRRQIFHYLHTKQFDVIFLQEVHGSRKTQKRWSAEWGSKIWSSNGQTNARGVSILFGPKINVKVHNTITDEEGQLLILYCTLEKEKFVLANIYAPNVDNPDFFHKCFTEIERFSPKFMLIGGDFNTALDPQVDRQGSKYNNDKSAQWIVNKCENLDLIDVYRYVHPDKPGYTYYSKYPTLNFSRLDYFLLSNEGSQFIESVKTIPSYKSDHSLLVLVFNILTHKRGPGYWKLNTKFLQDSEYVDHINDLLDREIEQTNADTFKDRWELIKLAVTTSSVQFAKNRSKSNKLKIQVLERKLDRLVKEAEGINPIVFRDTEDQIRVVKQELQEINKIATEGAILRSRARWAHLGEKPTKYFLRLEKRNFNKKTIVRLRKGNEIVEERHEILKMIKEFYQNLYTSKTETVNDYLDNLDIPRIPDDIKAELEKPFTEEEIGAVIKAFNNNRAPGTDGLPADWYKMFYPKIKGFLCDFMREIGESGSFHITATRGIISLLEKPESEEMVLKGWRPITLLNTDNKIFSKLLANRMQKALNYLIHPDQTGFMKGRQLTYNILKIMEVINQCEKMNINGLLVSFDIAKAFDTVEWSALFKTMQVYGFPEKFVSWVRVLFHNQSTTVLNNGFWSDWFNPS